MTPDYNFLPQTWVRQNSSVIDECAKLYSEHYGFWSDHAQGRNGKRIKLSPDRLRQWFASSDTVLATARIDNALVGYAIAVRSKVHRRGVITWVTQLVVHTDFRHQGIATNLLFSLWSFSDHYAWGLVSANPYAVRALEKATRRRVLPDRVRKNGDLLLRFAANHIPYINRRTPMALTDNDCRIDTEFPVDQTSIEERIRNVSSPSVPWFLVTFHWGGSGLHSHFQIRDSLN